MLEANSECVSMGSWLVGEPIKWAYSICLRLGIAIEGLRYSAPAYRRARINLALNWVALIIELFCLC